MYKLHMYQYKMELGKIHLNLVQEVIFCKKKMWLSIGRIYKMAYANVQAEKESWRLQIRICII